MFGPIEIENMGRKYFMKFCNLSIDSLIFSWLAQADSRPQKWPNGTKRWPIRAHHCRARRMRPSWRGCPCGSGARQRASSRRASRRSSLLRAAESWDRPIGRLADCCLSDAESISVCGEAQEPCRLIVRDGQNALRRRLRAFLQRSASNHAESFRAAIRGHCERLRLFAPRAAEMARARVSDRMRFVDPQQEERPAEPHDMR